MTTAMLTPELVLVDPELARAQRQTTYGKAAMSSTEPANGMFFVDQAQAAPDPQPQLPPLTPPAPAEPAPVAAVPEPVQEPAPPVAPPAAPAPEPTPAPTTPMVDVPLGTLIFRAGLLAEEQLEDALQEGMRTGKRLGEVLIERGWIAEKDLGRMLAGQKGLPYIEVTAADAQPDALQALPEQNARLQVALPLHYDDSELVVAVADPSNELVIENLRRALGSEPKLVVAPHGELLRAIGEAYAGLQSPQPAIAPAPAPAPEPVPQPQAVEPEPAVQLPPPVQATPAVEAPIVEAPQAVEPAAAASILVPEAVAPAPEPEPLQPLAAQTVAPLPTVVPPAEERNVEIPPAVPQLQSPLAPVVPEAVQPLTPAPVVEAPQAVEPVVQAPAPVAEAPLAQPEIPAPVVSEQPVAPVFPVEPVAEAVAPVAPPAVEAPAPAEAPAPFQAPPAATPAPEPSAVATQHVVLRLQDGETLDVGAFEDPAEASRWAQEIVRQIASAEGQSMWPFFANRYLRPDTIVSVDLVEESEEKWLGSSVRSRWAAAQT